MPTKLAIKSVTITIFMSSQLGRESIESNMLDKNINYCHAFSVDTAVHKAKAKFLRLIIGYLIGYADQITHLPVSGMRLRTLITTKLMLKLAIYHKTINFKLKAWSLTKYALSH